MSDPAPWEDGPMKYFALAMLICYLGVAALAAG